MWGSFLSPGGLEPYLLTKPTIHSCYAPFFSPLPNSHFSLPGIPFLTHSTFFSVSYPVDSQHTYHYTSVSPTVCHPSFPHDQTILTYFHLFSHLPQSPHQSTL